MDMAANARLALFAEWSGLIVAARQRVTVRRRA
jgi:hypothetical protein